VYVQYVIYQMQSIFQTGATSGKGSAYLSEAPVVTPGFSGVGVTRSLV
jgi:hypothetical protein